MVTNGSQEKCDASMLPAAGNSSGKPRFLFWDVVLAVCAGTMIFVILGVASFGVLGSTLAVVCILAAFGLAEYLLWGRAFGRGVLRKRQPQAHARSSETGATEPPDEFVLELNDRERMQLLELLERSLPPATTGPEGNEDGAAIRRELRDRIRMFGA